MKEKELRMNGITFQGEPPMMDFTLVKLNHGENLLDNQGGTIASLGSGELAKIITDAGQSLLNSIEATLKEMDPNQCIRVQILLHGNAGYTFVSPMAANNPSFYEKSKFVIAGGDGNPNNNNIINAIPKNQANQPNPVKTIVIVGSNLVNNGSGDGKSAIRHATLHDNEDNLKEGEDIINAT